MPGLTVTGERQNCKLTRKLYLVAQKGRVAIQLLGFEPPPIGYESVNLTLSKLNNSYYLIIT